jgi:hypothetical protein
VTSLLEQVLGIQREVLINPKFYYNPNQCQRTRTSIILGTALNNQITSNLLVDLKHDAKKEDFNVSSNDLGIVLK